MSEQTLTEESRAGAKSGDVSEPVQLELLEKLILVREFELACEGWWKAGEPLVGEFHLSLGQEAFAVGTCAAADPADPICPSIRGMGVYLCRGTSMASLIASFLEREGSISGGRWAHWHSPVSACNILPQTGMLGSGLVSAAGVAMAQKLRKSGRVVVAMLGDGASNTGYFHEGVNFAAAMNLPIVIVIENNQYAVSTPITRVAKATNLSDRAVGYGIPGITVDGTDVVAVYSTMREAIARSRQGEGPTLVELKAYRWGGQTLKDMDRTRPEEEKAAARQRCPIEGLRRRLTEGAQLTEAQFDALVSGARDRIKEAELEARALARLVPPEDSEISRVFNVYAS